MRVMNDRMSQRTVRMAEVEAPPQSVTAAQSPIPAERLTIVPANEASWDDVRAVFGTADYPAHCLCQM